MRIRTQEERVMLAHGWRSLALAVALIGGWVQAASADKILLQDGREVSGSLTRRGDDIVIKQDDGTLLTVKAADVKRVTLTGALTPAEKSEVEWTRIKATIAKSDDLPTILGLLTDFLRNYPDVPLAKSAKDMVGQYSGYQAQGFVKFRNRWLAAASRDAILNQSQTQARLALTLYRSGKLKEAAEAAKDSLKTDDQNTLGLSIAGLTSARAGQWVKAKEYFGKAVDLDATNVLAQNNVAIISFIQHREPEGLIHYKLALDAGPGNRLLLDNITEALAAYRGGKDVPAYIDLVRAFTQAETQMAAFMAQRGLYRFGSTWVTQEQKDRLLAAITTIQQNMADLDASYQRASATLQSLDQQARRAAANYDGTLADINSLDTSILQEQSRGFLDATLIAQRDALLADLNVINRRIQDIDAQRATAQADIKQMRVDAEILKKQMAAAEVNTYSGVQRMMEVGDADSPPPPAAVALPPKPAAVPSVPAPPHAVAPVPVVAPAPVVPSVPVVPQGAQWPAVNPQGVKPG
jgi:tetratricopeptide (TPR) repeat protein